MTVQATIFKAYDIRGRVGTELTTEVSWRVGRALADWLPEQGIVAVGRDMRPDSEELANELIAGLRAQGRDVWDLGQITSDMIYFAVGYFRLAGGAVVTASHNPGDDNGIKLCREKARPIGIESGLADVRDAVINNSFDRSPKLGTVTNKNIIDDWITYVLRFVDTNSWSAYRVTIDAGNGMAGAIIPHLEPRVPLAIDGLYFELDGTFPNHIANPLVPENLRDIQKRIIENKANFGIAFDGDGDRAVVIDEYGQALSGTTTTAILADYFLEKNPGATILYNAVTGRAVPEIVKARGGTSYRTKVGHSYIKAEMQRLGAVFAGEHSGHYYFKDNFNADSGLIAALIVIQVLAERKLPLSQLAASYTNDWVAISETNFTVHDTDVVLTQIRESFDKSSATIDTLDGLTLNYQDGWVNIRPSNTESLLRLNAEATSQDRLEKLVTEVRAIIEQ